MIIFPANYIGYYELYYSLKGMDLSKVLVVYDKGYADYFRVEGNHIFDDFKDSDKLIEKLEKWKDEHHVEFSGIIGIDDEEQFRLSHKIADYFDILFYEERTLDLASNKFLMKQAFEYNKINTGKFNLIRHAGDNKVGFPNVLKLITGSGSEFVFLNKNEEELKSHLDYMKSKAEHVREDTRFRKVGNFEPSKEFLVEGYLGGEEYSYDFAVDNDKIVILRIVKKVDGKNFGSYSAHHLINKKSAEHLGIKDLEKLSRKIADAFFIDDGVCMVDFKLHNGDIMVLESSIRPGFSFFIHAMQMLYGYTSLGVLEKLVNNELVDVKASDEEGLVVYLYAEKAGKIKKFDTSGLERLRKELDIIEIVKINKEGEIVTDSKEDHSDLLIGYAIVKNPKYVSQIIEKVKSSVVIEVE